MKTLATTAALLAALALLIPAAQANTEPTNCSSDYRGVEHNDGSVDEYSSKKCTISPEGFQCAHSVHDHYNDPNQPSYTEKSDGCQVTFPSPS